MENLSPSSAEITPPTLGVLGADLAITGDFSFHIWQQIFRSIVRNEKKALECGATVRFEIEVNERDCRATNIVPILHIELVCEPGKQARPSCKADTAPTACALPVSKTQIT
jgi:hypothetical protein